MLLKPIINHEQFYEKAEGALGVFGTMAWLSIYGNKLTLIGIYKDEQQLIGGFYYLKTKKYGFDFIKLPPYTPHCGLFFISDSKNKAAAASFNKEVMSEVCNFFSKLQSTLLILAFPTNIIDMQSFIWSKYKVIPNYTYRINLNQSIEEIKSHFDTKNRNMINKALKDEVEVRQNNLEKTDLFVFFEQSLLHAKANVYLNELKNIFFSFSNSQNSFHFSAFKNNQMLGTVFCIYDKTSCYYLFGGLHKDLKVQGVTNLLMQNSIEKAKALGCKIFDFEGSMLQGVEKFFRGFGPELVPFYTANKGKLGLELLLKFKKRELF